MGNKYTVTAGSFGREETRFGTEWFIVALYHLIFKVPSGFAHKALTVR